MRNLMAHEHGSPMHPMQTLALALVLLQVFEPPHRLHVVAWAPCWIQSPRSGPNIIPSYLKLEILKSVELVCKHCWRMESIPYTGDTAASGHESCSQTLYDVPWLHGGFSSYPQNSVHAESSKHRRAARESLSKRSPSSTILQASHQWALGDLGDGLCQGAMEQEKGASRSFGQDTAGMFSSNHPEDL